MKNKKTVCLFTIDPQNDFCDQKKGALVVTGADQDMVRLATMVTKFRGDIDDIQITLDCHHYVHIAHPSSWINQDNKSPNPFTIISLNDIEKGVWRAKNPAFQARYEAYVKTLAAHNRYPLCIWPPHCLIGSWGNNVFPVFYDALLNWEKQYAVVEKTTKGSNIFTEHYSAVVADVTDPEDPGTMLNTHLIDTLKKYDTILISGEALSHCVANTITDVAENFNEDQVKKFVLLEDASSNVTGFEKLGTDFVDKMKAKGMGIAKTTNFF